MRKMAVCRYLALKCVHYNGHKRDVFLECTKAWYSKSITPIKLATDDFFLEVGMRLYYFCFFKRSTKIFIVISREYFSHNEILK